MPDKIDIVSAARFVLQANGLKEGIEFSELTGISMEIDVVEFQDNVAGKVQLHKLPGKTKPATITLKRPMNSVIALWEWHEGLFAPGGYSALRRDGSLTMYDFEGSAVAAYNFFHAWPSKISLGGLKAGASEVMVEEVTLTCERLFRDPAVHKPK